MYISPLLFLAEAVNTFWDKFACFTTKKKMFRFPYMWEKTQRDAIPAYRWHQRHSFHSTKDLGKLACLVLFKILGIGTAERNWKQVKLIKTGQCSNIHADKYEKQVTLFGQNQQLRTWTRVEKLSLVDKLWEDGDFI
jgi:hypothetical protein